MVYGIVDARRGVVTLAQAGHPAPLLQRGEHVCRLEDAGFPVGMMAGMTYEQREHPFEPGDRLFLYSDGVTECGNAQRDQFRIERLEQCVGGQAGAPIEDAVSALEAALRSWRGGDEFADDVTILALERKAA
jgi:sigma-B regulation protein RsbU (phosphoserine phosphatase)